jgi:hypothetical protein
MSVCIERSLVDEHFEGRISPERESRLRAHLPGCESCSHYYERRVLLAKLDPSALSVEERLAIGLGLPRATAEHEPADATPEQEEPPAPSPRRKVLVMAVTLFAAAAVLLLWFFGKKPADDGFASRGKHTSSIPYVRVFQSAKGGVPEPLVGPVARTSELAFGYETTPDYDKLMIFGLDEHGHVYWYYPAWTDPSTNPAAVPLATNPELHPLREAIAHELDGRTLEVHALFSHESRSVREIEAALAGKKAPLGPLSMPASVDVVTQVEVLP